MKSLLTTAVAVLLLMLGLSAASFSQEYNQDRPGLDYRSFALSAADYRLCERACDADLACKAFTYVNPGVQGPSPMCYLKSSVPPKVANACCISGVKEGAVAPPPPVVDNDRFCRGYADEAVQQNRENSRENCGFTGNRWTNNRTGHFDFCSDNPKTAVQRESQARATQLQSCRSGDDEDDEDASICQTYTDEAVRAFKQGEQLECGFTGARWTGDRKRHLAFCQSASPEQRRAEQKARERDLARCRASAGNDDDENDEEEQGGSCRQFVQKSLEQAQQSKTLGCGFSGQRWSALRDVHGQFCRTKSRDVQRREIAKRGELLALCNSNPAKVQQCRSYSNSAVVQAKKNVARSCDFEGADWSLNYDTHFAWCMGNGRSSRITKLLARDAALARCR